MTKKLDLTRWTKSSPVQRTFTEDLKDQVECNNITTRDEANVYLEQEITYRIEEAQSSLGIAASIRKCRDLEKAEFEGGE